MPGDPYKYFRVEARELLDGLTEGVLQMEKGSADEERIRNLLRLAHTLKGAARVVKQPGMAELAHGMEDLLTPFRAQTAPAAPEQVREMRHVLEQIEGSLAALHPAPLAGAAPVTPAAPAAMSELLETVRVEVEEVEALLERIAETEAEFHGLVCEAEELQGAERLAGALAQQLQAPAHDTGALARIRAVSAQLAQVLCNAGRHWQQGLERCGRELGQARDLAQRLRLLPVAAVFPRVERTLQDAAVTLGKQIHLETAGGEIRLDAQVLLVLGDALLQLVRNAAAHGIEAPERRAAAGKPPAGRLQLQVERRGDRLTFRCQDDGTGLDVPAIRQVAVERGLLSPEQAAHLDLAGAIHLLFRGGVSTSGQVNEISGRGIGLDIVRAAVARLKGDIAVQSSPGKGLSVEIHVPASLTVLSGLCVESAGTRAVLPLDCVRCTLRVEQQQVAQCGSRQSVAYDRRTIPLLPLSAALGWPENRRNGTSTAVVVCSGQDLAALAVDRLLGVETVLVRPLPVLAPASPLVSGVVLDSQGCPRLFLDAAELVHAAGLEPSATAPREPAGAPVLIIDDSLTTRMVEQSILESEGYIVDLAMSGEEALEKALGRRYSLFLVDIEMPGMDGFEFISRTRAHPALREVPSILVTSRTSPEDRRRGLEAGARAYVAKTEFDQAQFLETVRQLVS